MVRATALAILIAFGSMTTGQASAACPSVSVPPAASALATTFMDLLKAGKGTDAVNSVIAASPLWKQRLGTCEQMIGQVDAGIRAYGPVIDYEPACSSAIGTSAYRQYYLARHRDMVTRWEFDLVRTGSGWAVAYFGFNDQVPTWF